LVELTITRHFLFLLLAFMLQLDHMPIFMHMGIMRGRGKGRNNVASLLLGFLYFKKWIVDGRCAKRLFIVMDNCACQNEYKMGPEVSFYAG
jgi:hypothetical protein